MNNQKMLIIGGANLDISGGSHHSLIAGDSNPGVIKTAAGGVGRNIAENLQRLGHPTRLLTMVGNDFARAAIVDSCQRAGIDVTKIIVNPAYASGTYLAISDQNGALAVAIADMAIIDQLLPTVLCQHQPAFDEADEIVIEANLPSASIQWLAQNVSDKPIHADAVSARKAHRLKPILAQLDILKVNRAEAAVLLEWQHEAEDIALAKGLYDLGVKQVLLSLGSRGAMLYSQHGAIVEPVFNVPHQQDNGAGDALFAGMISAQHWLKQQPCQLQFALACAALTLSSSAAVNPTMAVATIKQQFLTHLAVGAWY